MASSIRRGAADRRSENSPISAPAGPSSTTEAQPKDNMVSLADLNPYITCPICNGYFVDATTVIDCLHTFCKSCLLKYFEDNTDCPKCHYQIHQSHPSHYVAFDRTMQDIVYKLVPGMQAEEQRRREMFKQRQQQRAKEVRGEQNGGGGQANGASSSSGSDSGFSNSSIEEGAIDGRGGAGEENCTNKASEHGRECCSAQQDPITAHRRGDEQVLIQLLPDDKLGPIERSLVRLSIFATVNTVKRLLAYLLFNDITKYSEFDIFCNQELMGRDFSMAFIKKTRWRNKPEPVILMYKERIDF